jgi:hypothetical protein
MLSSKFTVLDLIRLLRQETALPGDNTRRRSAQKGSANLASSSLHSSLIDSYERKLLKQLEILCSSSEESKANKLKFISVATMPLQVKVDIFHGVFCYR